MPNVTTRLRTNQQNFNKHKKRHTKLLCDECGHVATSLKHLDEHKAMSHIPICISAIIVISNQRRNGTQ